ncbi:MAG: hypothetical protein Q8O03_08990 [Nanoarchaeota archaeon]|nr:hypothetical protein [Nanoarchaeota archaeon]
MKNLKLWQKAGLATLVALPLALGIGFTPNYNSGLESKLPAIGISVAEAKEVNPQGYQVPDLTGLTPYQKGYLKEEPIVYVERFVVDGRLIARMSVNGKIFAYDFNPNTRQLSPDAYIIVDTDGDGKFESKYFVGENIDVPTWVKS